MTRQITLVALFLVIYLNSFFQSKKDDNAIGVILPNCGIDSEWLQIKDFNFVNQEYFGVYERISKHPWDNYLLENYDSENTSVPKFLIKGITLTESVFASGKWIDRMLYLGETITFTVYNLEDESRSKTYRIYAKGNLIETENNKFPYFKKIEDYELIVTSSSEKINQSIIKKDINSWGAGGFEEGVYIYWIGDLNGDHLLDMLVGNSPNYKGVDIYLYLSDSNSKKLFIEHKVGSCSHC